MGRLGFIVAGLTGMAVLVPAASAQQKGGKSEPSVAAGTIVAARPSAQPAPASNPNPNTIAKSGERDCRPMHMLSLAVPQSSDWTPINPERFRRPGMTLQQLATRLAELLTAANYSVGFYCLSGGGFAVATRYERIDRNGAPCPGRSRWLVDARPAATCRGDTMAEIVARRIGEFWNPDFGRYRTLVIYVTEGTCHENSGAKLSASRARQLSHAVSGPPREVSGVLTSRTRITLYSYVYQREILGGPEKWIDTVEPVRDQLRLSGILLPI